MPTINDSDFDLVNALRHFTAKRFHLNRRLGPDARFEGLARITPRAPLDPLIAPVFDYAEEGTLIISPSSGQPNTRLQATRRYALQVSGSRLTVFYADQAGIIGSVFQEISLRMRLNTAIGRARHLCTLDIYDSTYVLTPDALLVVHKVTGPRKNYVSVSRLTRQQDSRVPPSDR